MKKVIKIISDVIFVLGLVGAGVFLLGHKTGKMPLNAFIVSSGSMAPEIQTGSIVLVLPKPSYALGDIITFYASAAKKSTTTHRIVGSGGNMYRVAGDANNEPDPGLVSKDLVVGRMLLAIPYVGFLAAFAKTPKGFILLVIVPATVIIYEELKSLLSEVLPKISRIKSKVPFRPIIILPVFFAILIPLTLTISYFIDHETAAGNSFVGAAPLQTPTPIPGCEDSSSTVISGNGAGSTNTVTRSSDCESKVNQSNSTSATTIVNIESNSGDNSGGNINTGSSSASFKTHINGGTNSF